MLVAAAPLLAPHDPNRLNMAQTLKPPSAVDPFGTDEVGRIADRIGVRFSVAAGLGRSLGGSLLLVHALVPTPPPTFGSACGALRTYRAEVREAEALLREAADMASDVVIGSELRFGDPPQAICQAAKDHGAELIVVGSRGLGRLNRLLLGSVSLGVVERARCSVLVVRAGVSADGLAASALEGATQ